MFALGSVILTRRDGRIQHLGTSMGRGRCAPSLDTCLQHGLDEAGARALGYVGTSFGAAFDAVNLMCHRGRPLSWGFWHLSGDALAACLGRWKAADDGSFDECLGANGVEVDFELDEDGYAGAPFVRCRRGPGGRAVHGEAAEGVIASDPSLVAALARGGRGKTAQFAQVQAVVVDALLPALAVPLTTDGCPLGEAFKTARGRAIVFYIQLTFGTGGVTHLAADFERRRPPGPDSLERWVSAFARRIHDAGATRPAHDLLQIASSPELVPA